MTTLTIYYGSAKPTKAVGKNQCHLLSFAEKYPGWHSYSKDRATLNAISGLVRKACIETNRNGQFRKAGHAYAYIQIDKHSRRVIEGV